MRLLRVEEGSGVSLLGDSEDDDLPEYAILSHTWGADNQEVTLRDIENDTAKNKIGYNKLVFSAQQSQRDGINHCWVDTCCIDKSNSVELNTAITSMFRWYQRAVKCYVYLSDVSRATSDARGNDNETWLTEFRCCRWLTRGWTLQELLAPRIVEFFDCSGEKLGDKSSLERHICEVTGIPAEALRGRPLSSFSVDERLSWQEHRTTKKPEDKAYSLLGVCGVSVIPNYGEGQDIAMSRLRRAVAESSQGVKYQSFAIPFGLAGVTESLRFVGRERELEEIHQSLHSDGRRRTVVLQGLGGMGKTQLAVAYAKMHRHSYSAILWFNVQDETLLKQSCAKIAKRILRYHPSAYRLSSIDLEGDMDDIVNGVSAWLSEVDNTRWLAIYDNYDNPKVRGKTDAAAVDISKFLPDADQGSVIITTRSRQVRMDYCIPVKKLVDVRESVEILSSVSRRELSAEDDNVLALARRLDGLPLALATAGAYLDQVTMTVADYLLLYETSWGKLHDGDVGLESYEDRTLYSTWRVSLDQITKQNARSAKMLRLWCYFAAQDLWYELLRAGPVEDIPWLQGLTNDLYTFSEAMRVLCYYGLVEGDDVAGDNVESTGYSIHVCVHSWIIHVLNAQWDDVLARYAIQAIARRVPDQDDAKAWITRRRLLPHADRCSQYLVGKRGNATLESLHKLGNLYVDQVELAEAERMYEHALSEEESTLGQDNTVMLDITNSLANLYADQDKLAEAERMYERALLGKEQVLGRDHTSTLKTVMNLGLLYKDQGKLAEAESMYERALSGYEKALGRDHMLTFHVLNNFANLYRDQDKLADAERMLKRALEGYESILGHDALTVPLLNTVGNLGLLYAKQGNFAEAEKLYKRAILGREKIHGPDNISTLAPVNNLGNLYAEQGKLEEAEEMYKRALLGKEKVLGRDHTTTLNTVHYLALLYKDRCRPAEAERMFKRALEGYEKAFGQEALAMPLLNTVNNLGLLYSEQGRLAEAETLYERALTGKEKILGRDNTSTLDTVDKLGLLYNNQGRVAEAETMYRRALEGYKRAQGNHETRILQLETLLSKENLSKKTTQSSANEHDRPDSREVQDGSGRQQGSRRHRRVLRVFHWKR